MLWRSKSNETPATPVLVESAEATSDASVDALGAILAALGEHALPIDGRTAEQIREEFDNWRRHLLIGASHPVDAAQRGRDFVGARRFATQFRREEMSFHRRVGKELRDVLWQLVSQVSSSLTTGQTDDNRAEQQLANLKSALTSGSVDALRAAATQTVQVLSSSIAERRERTNEQLGKLRDHISAMRDELEQARHALQIDALTKLYNRGAFDMHVVKVVELASLVAEPTAIFMIDIDHFKNVNDTHGHQTGDLVLRQVADMCVRCFPRGRDFVARYGGEELVAIAHDVDVSQVPMLAKRTLGAVRNLQTASLTGAPLDVTVSIGCTMLVPGESCTTWIARADQALYRAKSTGRNRAVLNGPKGDQEIL